MSALRQSQQPPAIASNPLFQMGTALQGFASGMHGQPNPALGILEQQKRQQDQQLLRQVQMSQIQGRLRKERDQRNQQLISLTDGLINATDPQARLIGWKERARLMKESGMQIPDSIVPMLAKGDIDAKKLDRATLYLASGMDDQGVMALTGLDRGSLAFARQLKDSDDMRHHLGLQTRAQMAKDVADTELKLRKAKLDEAKALLDERKADITEQREGRLERNMLEMRAESRRREDLAERRQDLAERRETARESEVGRRFDFMEKNLGKKLDTKEQRRQETLTVMEDSINLMESYADNLDKKNYLTKSAAGPLGGFLYGNLQPLKAAGNRELFPHDPDWVAWKQLQASLIGFDRTVLNDIGARAFQAFKNQFALFDNPPSKAAIDEVIKNMRRLLDDAKKGKIPDVENVTVKIGNDYYRRAMRRGDPLPPGATIIKVE